MALQNQQLDNTYEQLNAAIGFKASPVSGLWFNLYGGYQDLKNDLIDTPTVKSDGISNVFLTEDTKNLHAGADLSYKLQGCFLSRRQCRLSPLDNGLRRF